MHKRKVFYVTSPGNNNYRWFVRDKNDFYIMAHKNALSKSKLESHSFFNQMVFKEITVDETIAWVNYVLDNNHYISQQEFETSIYITTKYKQSIGRGLREPKKDNFSENQYKRGDIVIAKNEVSNIPWILKLGNFTNNKGETRWNLLSGFSVDAKGKRINNFGSAYAKSEDIIRKTTDIEKEYFEMCINEGVVLDSPYVNLSSIIDGNKIVSNIIIEAGFTSNKGKTSEMISFGKPKKNKTIKENKSVKLKINKIENYEY